VRPSTRLAPQARRGPFQNAHAQAIVLRTTSTQQLTPNLTDDPRPRESAEQRGDPGRRPGGQVRRTRRPHTWLLLVLPPLALVAVVFLYPVALIILRSFSDFVLPNEHGFANYAWFLQDDVQLTILRRTLITSLTVTAVCLAIGYPYAYLMTIASMRWRLVLLGLVLMPFWMSFIVRTFAWVILFQEGGPVPDLLELLGLGSVKVLGTTPAVMVGMVQLMLPYLVLPLYSAMLTIDRGLLTAASSLGASPRTAFARVYFPLSIPGILAGCIIVFILTLGFYFAPALLGSPRNSLLSQQIVIQVNTLLAFGRGGAMALILLVVTLLILAGGSLAARRWTRAIGVQSGRTA
jgi:putative spermidine/putrescine transport system permease protein